MLELKNIVKDYPTGSETVHALKGINLQFRKHEFVCILGPSGCGKTTMLNIIGGLDQYTSGDLVINGRSTKDYRDRDWDGYRNHSIGFVFQSYNLIPHQTVLQNVELALTLSGVSKQERRKRAKEALAAVGLEDQLRKRPTEMSGGQMQRVAIARAIVNNPDIILADEPTGALDTETSVQVMDILKELSDDHLIIMVTHNPDLAEKYATRIIRVLDGVVQDDSAPLSEEEVAGFKAVDQERLKRMKKHKLPSMSFFTSFGLSLKNLFTKKGRTLLTAFAGSIGIIGIALISSVSAGTNAYIDTVQEETLSSYPLTLEEKTIDMGSLIETFMASASSDDDHEKDAVYQKSMMYDLANAMGSIKENVNDLESFKIYLEEKSNEEGNALKDAISGIHYSYHMNLKVLTKAQDGSIIMSDPEELLGSLFAESMGASFSAADMTASSPMTSLMAGNSMSYSLWQEILPARDGGPVNDALNTQYDIVYGRWPSNYDEVVIVLDKNNEISDLSAYSLGLIPREDVKAVMDAAFSQQTVEKKSESWSYEDVCGMDFRAVLPSSVYSRDEHSGTFNDLTESDAGLRYLYSNAIKLKVVGIVRPNPDAISSMLVGTVAYTHGLTEYIINESAVSDAVQTQVDNPTTDIFTGLEFRDSIDDISDDEKEEKFRSFAESLDTAGMASLYTEIASIPDQNMVDMTVDGIMAGITRENMEEAIKMAMNSQLGMDEDTIITYIESMQDEELSELYRQAVEEQVKQQMSDAVKAQMAAMDSESLAGMLLMTMPTYTTEDCAKFFDETMEFSDASYDGNLLKLGKLDLAKPSSINLYASSFENKDIIEDAIKEYNESVEEVKQLSYTDYVGIMMNSVTTIINAITYVLIAFVAISLIVSSIMIGVITLISVQERTKEIGILRAIGASKRNVSRMFNAETVIIGFAAGVLGVGLTYLLCIPINIILHKLTGLGNLNAILRPEVAIALVIISVLLTLIAGIIPSRSAAKKDPVVALRTE